MKKIFCGLALLVLAGCGSYPIATGEKAPLHRALSVADNNGTGGAWDRPSIEIAVFESLLRCQTYNPYNNCKVIRIDYQMTAASDQNEWKKKYEKEINNYEQYTDRIFDPGNGKMATGIFLRLKKSDLSKNTKPNENNSNDLNSTEKISANNKNSKLTELENLYSKKCEGGIFSSGFKKGTKEFVDCVKKEENKDLAEQKKKHDLVEASKKKLETESKQAADKIAKMSPDDRRAYICNEKYGFRKGSDNFKDCIFKIYSAEIELEKLELQKQLAKANADLAKANTNRQDSLAKAQTETARMQAYAAQQQAIAANTADSLALMESGLRMMSPQTPAVRTPMNCRYIGNMLSCF